MTISLMTEDYTRHRTQSPTGHYVIGHFPTPHSHLTGMLASLVEVTMALAHTTNRNPTHPPGFEWTRSGRRGELHAAARPAAGSRWPRRAQRRRRSALSPGMIGLAAVMLRVILTLPPHAGITECRCSELDVLHPQGDFSSRRQSGGRLIILGEYGPVGAPASVYTRSGRRGGACASPPTIGPTDDDFRMVGG